MSMSMDWFSWLSNTGLEPSLVYEYGLAFAHNELEEEDIAYFDHQFLQSIGVSIAKHRLQIIKLAEKESRRAPRGVSRLIAIINNTKRCLANCIHAWMRRGGDSGALIVVPATAKAYGKRWRGALLKRNKRMMMVKQARLMITDGRPSPPGASPLAHDLAVRNEDEVVYKDEIRWASMFQDLKPT
ncbi:hypothetical protein ACLOJK_027587 [Asimina triloba]